MKKTHTQASRLLLLGLLTLSALCVAALLCGCGGNDNPADTAAPTETDTPNPGTEAGETDTPEAESQSDMPTEANETAADTEPATEAETRDPLAPAARETRTFDKTIEITENGGTASVKTADGLTYTAAGYTAIKNGVFVIKEGFTVTFPEGLLAGEFNRFRMSYSSTLPLHFYITYTVDGEDKTEDYYAEAGTDLFCGLIDNFGKKRGTAIKSIEFKTCTGANGSFALCGLDTQILENPAIKTYYIENDRFKLGLNVQWGWTISYLEDKNCTIKGITNMINLHDSGRLVQQSYYGTVVAQGDFTPGRVGNEDWMYNPVQAGDYQNNGSRVIDIVEGYNSVYVKVQPYDWGQVLWLCPAYMENVYTVEEDTVRVDNRYVEFSNYDNPVQGQELPAFYTVSWFNEFAWYDGDKSWTDDKISYNTNIEMVWTSTEHLPNFGSYTKIDNTEVWCALFSREDNYGIGMYVPNVDYRSVGVYHPEERSKKPNANSCSYMGASRVIKLVSYEPLEYSYLIACGSVEEIRDTFKAHKNFATNEALDKNATDRRVPGESLDITNLDFTDPAFLSFISQINRYVVTYEYDAEEEAVRLTTSGPDPYFSINFMNLSEKLQASDYTGIEIEYMVPTTNSGKSVMGFELFLSCGTDKEAAGGKSVKGYYKIDDLYHTVTVDFTKLSFWDGQINKIRLDYLNECEAGDTVYIKSIRLLKAE